MLALSGSPSALGQSLSVRAMLRTAEGFRLAIVRRFESTSDER